MLVLKNEVETLTKVTELLESGKLKHHTKTNTDQQQFNMNYACSSIGDCGTVSCIGGTACILENPTVSQYTIRKYVAQYKFRSDGPLSYLYYPTNLDEGDYWEDITPKQAAVAIRKYLSGVNPENIWDHVDFSLGD